MRGIKQQRTQILMTLWFCSILICAGGQFPLKATSIDHQSHVMMYSEEQSFHSMIIDSSNGLLSVDYVIITSDKMSSSLDEFKIAKTNQGYTVQLVTISWITSAYEGRDRAESIKLFLHDAYQSWNVQYVLLIGTNDTIPMRSCYPMNYYPGAHSVPSDMYYADINSDWDGDQDERFGELEDDIDGTAELFIGRIPFDEKNKVKKCLNQSLFYQRDNGQWKKQVLQLGSFLWLNNYKGHQNTETDGAVLLESLWYDFLSPAGFSRIALYEKEGLAQSVYPCDLPLNRSNLRNVWSNGFGLVNWVCHGTIESLKRVVWKKDNGDGIPYTGNDSVQSVVFFSNRDDETGNDLFYLNTSHPSILFSTGCDNANICNPYRESLAESLLGHNVAAFIGSTADAYGPFNWTTVDDGGIETLNYLFYSYLIGQNKTCAEALSLAKEMYLEKYMDIGPRWWNLQNLLTVHVFGDPSIYVQDMPSPPVMTGPNKVKKDEKISFSFVVSDPQGSDVFLQIDWGDNQKTDWMGPFASGSQLVFKHQWDKKGTIMVKARLRDEHFFTSMWSEKMVTVRKAKQSSFPSVFFTWIKDSISNWPIFNSWFY